MEKLYSLQILRALAAWIVVFHHYNQYFYHFTSEQPIGVFFTKFGDFGVDVFFVLSGLVMFMVVRNKDDSAYQFFIKRLIRVAPAYWFYTSVLVLVLLLELEVFSITNYNALSLLCSYLFIPSENPSGIGHYPVLNVGWTLIVEMVFYTTLALSILISKKYSLYICTAIISLFALLYPDGNIYSLVLGSFVICQFLFGFVIGFYYESRFAAKVNEKIPGILQAMLALPIALGLWLGVAGHGLLQDTLAAFLIVYSCVQINSYFSYSSRFAKFWIRSGDYSYSIYLSHIIILGLMAHLLGNQFTLIEEIGVIVLAAVAVHTVSALSFQFIEQGWITQFLKKHLLSQQPKKATLDTLRTQENTDS